MSGPPMIEIALYEPDIPPNTGTILRMAACLGVAVSVIEPVGFTWSDRSFRRAGLDYRDRARIFRHDSFPAFRNAAEGRRLVLMTTRATLPYWDFAFRPDDILLMGRETGGVPDDVHATAAARLVIPLEPGFRSLNVAVACAMVLGEALRQTRQT